jgi:putative ABC transport system permease protein
MQVENGDLYDEFSVKASNGTDPASLSMEIQDYINTTFYQDNDAYESYSYSMKEQLKQMNAMLNTQKNAFMAIGAIALLVGGIGVMNIMMVSITERTREIGTRKALGATNASLLFQFITEAVLLCLIGGLIGIILGIIFGIIACRAMGVPYVLEPLSIVISVLFSLLIGGFFGYYPASRAAKMDPIEALRYE